jgi:hypothetical protein
MLDQAAPPLKPSLRVTVESLRRTLRDPSISAAERDEALADFVRRLVDKYLRSPGAVPAHDSFSAVSILSSFATQYPQAFGYGDPRRVGHVILGLLEQLPAASQPAHASLLLHALRTTLLLLRASDAHAFATLGAEAVALLACWGADTGASPIPCFLGFAAACSGDTPNTAGGPNAGGGHNTAEGGDGAQGRAAPAMLLLGGPQHAVLWSGLLRLAAAMHADAPQFLGDGGPALWYVAPPFSVSPPLLSGSPAAPFSPLPGPHYNKVTNLSKHPTRTRSTPLSTPRPTMPCSLSVHPHSPPPPNPSLASAPAQVRHPRFPRVGVACSRRRGVTGCPSLHFCPLTNPTLSPPHNPPLTSSCTSQPLLPPLLRSAIRDSLELASLALADAAPPLQALKTLLQQHPAPPAVRYHLLHSLLSLLCLQYPGGAQQAPGYRGGAQHTPGYPGGAPHTPGLSAAADGASTFGDVSGAGGGAAGGLSSEEYDELLGKCLTPLISSLLPPLPVLPQLLQATPPALTHSRSGTLHAAICRLWCTLPRHVLARHVRALELFLGCPNTQHLVIPCFLLALAPPPFLSAPGGVTRSRSASAATDSSLQGSPPGLPPGFLPGQLAAILSAAPPAVPPSARPAPSRPPSAMGAAHAEASRAGYVCIDISGGRDEASPVPKRRRHGTSGMEGGGGEAALEGWGGGKDDAGAAVRARLLELAMQVRLGSLGTHGEGGGCGDLAREAGGGLGGVVQGSRGGAEGEGMDCARRGGTLLSEGEGLGGRVPSFRRLCAIGLVLLRAPAPDAAAARAREKVRALLAEAFEWLRRLVLPDASRLDGTCSGRVHSAGTCPGHVVRAGDSCSECGGRGGHAKGGVGGGHVNGAAGAGGGLNEGCEAAGCYGAGEPGGGAAASLNETLPAVNLMSPEAGSGDEWRERTELLGVALGLMQGLTVPSGDAQLYAGDITAALRTVSLPHTHGSPPRMGGPQLDAGPHSGRGPFLDAGQPLGEPLDHGPRGARRSVGPSLLPPSLAVEALHLASLLWVRGSQGAGVSSGDVGGGSRGAGDMQGGAGGGVGGGRGGAGGGRGGAGDDTLAKPGCPAEAADTGADAEASRRRWTLSFAPALRCEALAVLMRVRALLPAEAEGEGAMLCARTLRTVLVDATERAARTPVAEDGGGAGDHSEPAGEARVLCAALQALPALAAEQGLAPLAGCIDAALSFLLALEKSGGPERPHAAAALADSLGRLACVHAGRCRGEGGWGGGVPRCSVCDGEGAGRERGDRGGDADEPWGAAGLGVAGAAGADGLHERPSMPGQGSGGSGGQRAGGVGGAMPDRSACGPAGGCVAPASSGSDGRRVAFRLYESLPLLWSLLCALPAGDNRVRAALVLCIGRLGRHAPPALISRHVQVMQSVVGLLADPSADVSAACAVVLPRLLGCAAFVRVVGLRQTPREGAAGGEGGDEPAGGGEAGVAGGGGMGAGGGRVAGAGGGWETGAGGECDSPLDGRTLHDLVLSPLVAMLKGSPSPPAPQFRLALLTALGALGREPLYSDHACRGAIVLALSSHLHYDELSREYGTAMRELRALAVAAGCEDATASEPTTEALCRGLLPQLAPEWVWWVVETPDLLAPTAARLLDASVTEMLQMIIPHALPTVVLAGGLGLRGVYPQGERGRQAMRLLELLAEQVGQVKSKPRPKRTATRESQHNTGFIESVCLPHISLCPNSCSLAEQVEQVTLQHDQTIGALPTRIDPFHSSLALAAPPLPLPASLNFRFRMHRIFHTSPFTGPPRLNLFGLCFARPSPS